EGDALLEGRMRDFVAVAFYEQGRVEDAAREVGHALRLLEPLDDKRSLALALLHDGTFHLARGRLPEANALYERARKLARHVQDSPSEATALGCLAYAHAQEGRGEAITLYSQAIEQFREHGDHRGEAITLTNMALLLQEQGRMREALSSYD